MKHSVRKIYSLALFLSIPAITAATIQILPKTVVPCTTGQCRSIDHVLNKYEQLEDQAIVYQTSDRPEFMRRYEQEFIRYENAQWQNIIIDETALSDTHPIIGFGGAFTDSTAIIYKSMPPTLQEAFIRDYFSSDGIEYSLGRVPMGSNDFSCRRWEKGSIVPSLKNCSSELSLYSYADNPSADLLSFALSSEDITYKIQMIQSAFQVMNAQQKSDFKLFASPWSAPAWMKTNGSMVHGGLNDYHQQLWADYFVKFLQAYQQYGIKFWGVTVQNEPVKRFAVETFMQHWQSMFYSRDQEANFIQYYLGPTLHAFESEYGAKINIMMHDDQITTLSQRLPMLQNPKVAKYVSGVAFHWYSTNDLNYHLLDKAYDTVKDTLDESGFILSSEACQGYLFFSKGPLLGSWQRGESYAHDIISDLNHHVSGWTDWNMLLDINGGPNWAKNNVDAPIIYNQSKQAFYKQPMYYFMGHFSKFLKPGATRLQIQNNGVFPLETVVFRVPAQTNLPETIVVIVLNRDISGRDYYIKDLSIAADEHYLNMHIPPHAIQTIIYRARKADQALA